MDLDKWWSGLRISEKEKVASKILLHNPELTGSAQYPDCTEVWKAIPVDTQIFVYKHCVFKHGYLEKIDYEGEPYSE